MDDKSKGPYPIGNTLPILGAQVVGEWPIAGAGHEHTRGKHSHPKSSAPDPIQRAFASDIPVGGVQLDFHARVFQRHDKRRLRHRLVEQLLQLASLAPDASDRPLRAKDLAGLVKSAVADFSVLAHARGIDLGAEIGPMAPGAAAVRGDAQHLQMLLDNLVATHCSTHRALARWTSRCV